MEGYQGLANAIVEQAAKDYVSALRFLKKHPGAKGALKEALEIEDFFHSEWYALLTDVDPDYLIKRLREGIVK
ncbi:MAG: hypothetical protein IKP40_10025 [Clostridia bacterium]|nr:hypothetical protein [Clostridia bacterium]